MKLTLKVWRQNGPRSQGHFETHEMPEVSEDMSFLEMIDVLNERLVDEERAGGDRAHRDLGPLAEVHDRPGAEVAVDALDLGRQSPCGIVRRIDLGEVFDSSDRRWELKAMRFEHQRKGGRRRGES